MASRTKIALLLSCAEEEKQKLFINGFLNQMFAYDCDVCCFAMYNSYQDTIERECGESEIFSLINYEMFDGFVVLSDTIQTPGLIGDIEEKLKNNFNGPVICVDKKSKHFCSFVSESISPKQSGIFVAKKLKEMLDDEAVSRIGELSPGDDCEGIVNSDELEAEQVMTDSQKRFASRSNHMMEDMLTKSDFNDFMNTIFAYVYYLEGFDSFSLCLNSQWNDSEQLYNSDTNWDTYSEQILPIIRCRRDGVVNQVNIAQTFKKELLIPELHDEREHPAAFFFTPLHFEDRCLGYAVISYGNEARGYDDVYCLWLRNVMQGLEIFYRIDMLRHKYELLEVSQTKDTLTGLYNYQGMLQQCNGVMDKYAGAIAVDIRGLSDINDKYGRGEGNYAIKTVAGILKNQIKNGFCCVIGNGEFVGVEFFNHEDTQSIHTISENILKQLEVVEGLPYKLAVYVGCENVCITNIKDIEHLINTAVAQKNGNKIAERKMLNKEMLTADEYKEMLVVKDIMDHNRLQYHFQPIVNAKTGEVYAYEALMRAEVTPYVSPLTIIKYADYMGRLYDVERLTFFNVLERIAKDETLFEGKKVFVNSIPDNRLQGEDAEMLRDKLKKHSATVVVELTEQAEIPDNELALVKQTYASMGIETAVDDYGTGYSNITNLLRYMPDYVKIDRMLLSEIQDSPQKQHFVREIIDFAHDNNIKALAEGIETSDELEMVVRLGIDLIQGYYTARPSETVLSEIDKVVKDEIGRYQRQVMLEKGSKIYIAGKESRINLVKLAADKYSCIEFVPDDTIHKDVAITGMNGVTTNIVLDIRTGYNGRIVLDSVNLSAGKRNACITIGENCNVVLVLKGDNHFKDGGIRVAESASLTIEGDGDLSISSEKNNYFGIGNDVDSAHGSVIFDQDGCIEIHCNGAKGVGIGSGYGGEIDIRRGKYIIELAGEKGVGIGTHEGDVSISIAMCNMSMRLVTTNNVGIGSIDGNLDVHISHILMKGYFGGTFSAGIGTLHGEKADIDIVNSFINCNMRAPEVAVIGSAEKEANVSIKETGINIKGEGRNAISFGNYNKNCKVSFIDCDIYSDIKSNLESDIGAKESDVSILNGRVEFLLNGKAVVREAKSANL